MRRFLGGFLLVAGLGALGVYGANSHARDIQDNLRNASLAVVRDAPHGVRAAVSGRDVVVTGTARDAGELASIVARLDGLDGRRLITASDVTFLPVAAPFRFAAERNADGDLTLSGAVPSEAARAHIAAPDATSGLILSNGVPDNNWADAIGIGLGGLNALISGELLVTDRQLILNGRASGPETAAAANAALAGLPDGYSIESQIALDDDGAPLRLSLSLLDGVVRGSGKFPDGMSQVEITDRFESTDTSIAQAVIAAFDPLWPAVATTGMDALALLVDGTLDIEQTHVSLIGTGTPDAIVQAERLMAAVPDTYVVSTDLTPWDDGVPLSLSMTWDSSQASVSGKFPAGFSPRGPAGVAVTNTGTNSFLDDETGAFTANATAGITALGLMSVGTLDVSETEIVLTGSAASPQVRLQMDAVLAGVADQTTVRRDLTYLDDGSPASWTLTYDANSGATVEGRLPRGLAIDDVGGALGLDGIAGVPATALDDDDQRDSLDVMAIIAGYLPEIETLEYALDSERSTLDLVVSPGVDIDLVASDLAQRLASGVAFSISPLDPLPPDGTGRTNAATGLTEVLTEGFWLPALAFDPDLETCTDETRAALAREDISFLSSSARLDATSIRTINALAVIVQACVDADLSLEVGGHTDATGDAAANDALSQDRANAVRDALIARGIPGFAMTAFGFGQTQPIADNDTPEGRATNRRTDITWFAADAVRDP